MLIRVGWADALPPQYEQSLAQLGSDDFTQRQHASQQLLADPQLTQEAIESLYTQAHLPEQRHRILALAKHHLLRQMIQERFKNPNRGAIGIRHEPFAADQFPGLNQPGLVVIRAYPGFPAYAHLFPGDRIVEVDGQSFRADLAAAQVGERFVQMVQDHPPNSTVRFTVYRDGQPIQVQFTVANLEALQAMHQASGQLQKPFSAAWQARRKALVALGDTPPASPQEHPHTPQRVADSPKPPQAAQSPKEKP